jgi:HSP20 family protein
MLTNWNDPFDMMMTPFSSSSLPSSLGVPNNSNSLTRDLAPLMGTDLIENEKEYQIHCDLPGVSAEDVHITIEDKYLCLKAERRSTHEENNDHFHSRERQYGTVCRKIHIPSDCDLDGIQSNMKNGVLLINLPKKAIKESKNIRKIPINFEK